MIRIRFALPLLLVSCATPDAPPPQGPVKDTIKIVSALPRTGSTTLQTDAIVNGIRLAFEGVGWRVGDHAIAFEDVDYFSATGGLGDGLVESTAHRIAQDPDVMVCIGTYDSGSAKAYLPILNRANLLMISPVNTWPGLTRPGWGEPEELNALRPTGRNNYVRVVPADDVQAGVAAHWALKSGVKRVYVLDDRQTYGKGMADRFRKQAVELGLTVIGQEGIDVAAADCKPALAKVKGLGPDLVYFGGTPQTRAGQVARDLASVGLKCKFMVPDACLDGDFIAAAGAENLEKRCFITFGWIPPERLDALCAAFVVNYWNKFRVKPETWSLYGYEAARVAIEAIRRAGTKDREAIRAACLALRDFDGMLGKWSFDANGDTTAQTTGIYTVRNGEFKYLEMTK